MSGSTGQIIGGVVGAVIGFYAGGNVAAGWAIGSAIGGAIDPQKVDGPRLQDRTVQVSTYGAAIPIIYGGDAGTGNVIWSTDLIEHDAEEDGKGGAAVISHTYSVSCAILIGEGPIAGIRRIWADAKLVYDVSDTASEQTQLASVLFADYFVFYSGSETQLPDPTMEAVFGVGNVPAYLGSSYIVFTDLPLENYGNRIPNFKFETSEQVEPVSSGGTYVYEPLTISEWGLSGGRPIHGAGGPIEFRDFSTAYSWTDYDTARVANAALQSGSGSYSETFIGYSTSTNAIASEFPSGATTADSPRYVNYWMAVQQPDLLAETIGSGAYCGALLIEGATPDDGLVYWTADASNYSSISTPNYIVKLVSYGTPSTGAWAASVNNCTDYPPVGGHFPFAQGNAIVPLRAERIPGPPPNSPGCQPGDPCLLGMAQLPRDPNYCISCDGTISVRHEIVYEVISGTFKQLCAVEYRSNVLYQNALGPVLLPSDPNYDNGDFWANARDAAIADGSLHSDVTTPVVVSQVARGTLNDVDRLVAAEANTTLDVIVSDICDRAGLASANLDVTDLAGIPVQGYSIARQMLARAAILPLQQVYWWDFVESGSKVKAVLRGAPSAANILVDDLGATESSDIQVAVTPNRGQEAELPATVNVAYPVREKGYEVSTQRARRVVTASQQIMSMELDVVMEDSRASDVADVLMYSAWTNRTERSWSTTRKYADFEPTDVVSLDDGEFIYQVRITQRSEEGGVIKWNGVDERPAIYSPNTVAGESSSGIGDIRYDGPMKLELIDSPILHDSNDDAGIYAAAAGYLPTWSGGSAFKSTDGGASYSRVLTMKTKATLGYAISVLGDYAGGSYTIDRQNTVNVRMHNGTLASVTWEQFLSEANAAIIGNEIIVFKDATLVAEGIYTLSTLLRGRRGTEQHMASHVVDERFVLFNGNTIYRMPFDLSELNVAEKFKGVTFGQTLEDALEIDFTNTGAGLKPLSPVHLVAIDVGGGQRLIRWDRRTRIGPTWRDYVDAPIGEISEQYEVLVNGVSAGTVTTTELEVTATTGDTITVYQLSDKVGRGFPATIQV